MPETPYRTARIPTIPSLRVPYPTESTSEWKPVRHHLGVRAFGVNAFVAPDPGELLVGEHDELAEPGDSRQEHEELYFVTSGRATFTVGGETVDAPAGTFVFLPDPAVVRSAVAREAGTTLLAIGAQPGVPYEVSAWERRRTGE